MFRIVFFESFRCSSFAEKWLISAGEMACIGYWRWCGTSPLWSPNGRELFYLTGDSTTDAAMRVAVETQPTFKSAKPGVLFRGTYVGFYPSDFPWDISPDGKRFLMMKLTGATPAAGGPRKINIVLNWFEELKQRAPLK